MSQKDKQTIEKLKKEKWQFSRKIAREIHEKAIECEYIGEEEERHFFVHVLGIKEERVWNGYKKVLSNENEKSFIRLGKYTVFLDATDKEIRVWRKEKNRDKKIKDENTIKRLKEEGLKFSIKTAEEIHSKATECEYVEEEEEHWFFIHILGINKCSWENYKKALENKDDNENSGKLGEYTIFLDATMEEKKQRQELQKKRDRETIEKLKAEHWKFSLRPAKAIHDKAIECGYVEEGEEYHFFVYVLGIGECNWKNYQEALTKKDEKNLTRYGKYTINLDATKKEKAKNSEDLGRLIVQVQKEILSDGYYPGQKLMPYQIDKLYIDYIDSKGLPIKFRAFYEKIVDISSSSLYHRGIKHSRPLRTTIHLNKRRGHEDFIKEWTEKKEAGRLNRRFTREEIETICTENGIDIEDEAGIDFFINFIVGAGYRKDLIEDYKGVLKSSPEGIWVGNNIPLSKGYLDEKLLLLQETIAKGVNKFCNIYSCFDQKEDYMQDCLLSLRENAGEIEKNFKDYDERTNHHFAIMIKTHLHELYFQTDKLRPISLTRKSQYSEEEYTIQIPDEQDFGLEDEEVININNNAMDIVIAVMYEYIGDGVFDREALIELIANSIEERDQSPEYIEALIVEAGKIMIDRGLIELTR